MSGRLGIVTGRDLAQHCGQRYPRTARWLLWLMLEVAIVSVDIQVGGALPVGSWGWGARGGVVAGAGVGCGEADMGGGGWVGALPGPHTHPPPGAGGPPASDG